MRLVQVVLSVLITLLSLVPASAEEQVRYKIGVITPLSGNFASYGKTIRQAIESHARPDIQFIFEDEGCTAAKAVAAYKKLSELDEIKFIIGPGCGSPQQAVAPLLKSKEQLVMFSNSAPEDLFIASGRKILSTQYSIGEESKFIAEKIAEMGFKRVVLLSSENQFSGAHEKAFRKSFRGTVVNYLRFSPNDPAQLKGLVLKLKSFDFDALYVPDAFPFMIGLRKKMYSIGLQNKKVFSVYSAQSKDVLTGEGRYAEGLLYSYPDIEEQDAIGYFPSLAAKILTKAVVHCKGKVGCTKRYLTENHQFSELGTLKTPLILKTIRDGRFIKYTGRK